MPHPDTQMERASHALVDGNEVWLVDPLDAEGVDEELADHYEREAMVYDGE